MASGDGQRDRCEILDWIVGNMGEQRWIDYMGAEREENSVAVGCRLRDLGSADIAARARYVLNVELLTELFREFLRHEPGEGIGHAAGCKGDYRAHWPRRIGLRTSGLRDGQKRGSTSCHR